MAPDSEARAGGRLASPPAAEAAPRPEAPDGPVSFVEDDFPAALAQARSEGKLLFVDVWAPWCHTCLSMRSTVLRSSALNRWQPRVVFAALDSDRPESAPFLERYRVEAWPTLFVIQPRSGAVLAMHAGAASLGELEALLESASSGRSTPMSVLLMVAHAHFAAGAFQEALEAYRSAAAATNGSVRSQALLGAIRCLWEIEDFAACASLGAERGAAVEGISAPIDFSFYAFECAHRMATGPERDTAIGATGARIAELVAHPPAGASPDDLGDLYALGARAKRSAGDLAGARALEERGLSLLEASARRAERPEVAQVHDYARMKAYLALGRADEAIAMLEQRCRQLPDRYEPHARLAAVLVEVGRPADALAPLSRALSLSYGPRRLRYLAQKADVLAAVGDRAGRIAALREEVRGWSELPAGQRSVRSLDDARKRLADAEGLNGPANGESTPRR